MLLVIVFATVFAGEARAVSAGLLSADASGHQAVTPHGGWTYPRARQQPQTTSSISAPTAAPMPAIDPMAPRADAPVLRMNDTPTPDGARYYSIHRQTGRSPDAPTMPAPVYLDALPVGLNNLPQGEDLAAPPPAPQMMRDNQGRMRPVVSDDF